MSYETHKAQKLKIKEIENLLHINPNISEKLDKEIINLFYPDDKRFVRSYSSKKWRNEHYAIWKYIDFRYDDSVDFKETFYRLRNNIVEKPKCRQCGKSAAWLKNGYSDFCSISCSRKNNRTQELYKKTCLKKYGVEFPIKSSSVKEKIKQTHYKHYGTSHHMQNEEFIKNFSKQCFEKYGVNNYGQTTQAIEKRKKSMISRFGVDNAFKSDTCKAKAKETIKKQYGVDNIGQSNEVKNKIRQTCLERYGETTPLKCDEVKNKIRQTCLERYGVEYASQSEEVKSKVKETCLERYGVEYFMQNKQILDKSKETCLKHYGVESFSQSDEFKKYCKEHHDEIQRKTYETKKKNGTFNCSKQEEHVYKLLSSKYDNVLRQYSDDKRYPFACDYYIPQIDMFIEFNAHWTHGGKPFTGSDEDLEKLEYWKSKHTKYYDIAVRVWSISDVNKRNIAEKNNLNYLEFWNINEAERWIKK